MESKSKMDGDEFVGVRVTELISSMGLSEETLYHDMLDQPKLFLQASRYRVAKMKARFKAEALVSQLRVDAAIIVRQRNVESETKVTEKAVEEQVSKNPKVREAEALYDEAKAMEEWAKLLLDSFRERGSMAKALVQLLGAEAAMESGLVRAEFERMGIDKLKEQVRNRYPGT